MNNWAHSLTNTHIHYYVRIQREREGIVLHYLVSHRAIPVCQHHQSPHDIAETQQRDECVCNGSPATEIALWTKRQHLDTLLVGGRMYVCMYVCMYNCMVRILY